MSVWREAPNIFNEEEQLLLEMTEEITLIHQHGLERSALSKSNQSMGRTTNGPCDDGYHQYQFIEPDRSRIEFASGYIRSN